VTNNDSWNGPLSWSLPGIFETTLRKRSPPHPVAEKLVFYSRRKAKKIHAEKLQGGGGGGRGGPTLWRHEKPSQRTGGTHREPLRQINGPPRLVESKLEDIPRNSAKARASSLLSLPIHLTNSDSLLRTRGLGSESAPVDFQPFDKIPPISLAAVRRCIVCRCGP